MMLGDIAAQRVTTPKEQQWRWDKARTARFGVVGLTLHGPYFFSGMRAIDKRFGPEKSFVNAAKKAVASQVILFPPFVTLLFGWVGVLEGKSPSQCVQKIKDNFGPAFNFGMVFWPTANLINFRYINPHQRVLYVSCAGLIWNTFIRYFIAIASPLPMKQLTATSHSTYEGGAEA